MKKKNYLLLGIICFLVIGFAIVSTTLVLNGNTRISENLADFGIYFSKSILDSKDVSKETISTNGQSLNFETKLINVEQISKLEYEVTNSSKNYDARVSIECQFNNEDNPINFDEYITMTYENNNEIIPARTTGTGIITLKQKKAVIDDIEVGLKCNLKFDAIEREELGTTPVENSPDKYSLSGYLISNERKILPNKNLVILTNDNIYITTNNEAYLTIQGLDMGFHDIYIIENKTIDEIKNMSKEEVEENALTKAKFTQSSKEITFDNGYKIVSELPSYKITFNACGGEVSPTQKEVVYKKTYGELPIPTKDGYMFVGWYTEEVAGNEVKSSTKLETESDQTLYAHWEVSDILVDVITQLAKTDTTNLLYDGTKTNNLRYVGENPNNYVSFNGELWRIIGVMNDVEDSFGIKGKQAKLIKEEALSGYYSYDNKATLNNYGSNDWSTSTLQKMLNSGAYWKRTSGKCPAGTNGYTTDCDFTSNGLTNKSKKMISETKWNLGGRADPAAPTNVFYENERGKNVLLNHASTWTGKVGLMYPSDYGYAVGGDARNTALPLLLSNYSTEEYESFSSYNWLLGQSSEWTLTPSIGYDYTSFYKGENGSLSTQPSSNTLRIRPTVYLGAYIRKTNGDGTKEHPYEIAINNNIEYKVRFDSNGGEKVDTILSVSNGEPYGELPSITREQSVFEGWYTEKEGGTQITSETVVETGVNQTLYAHWAIRGILKDGIAELAKTEKTNLAYDKTSDNNLRYIGSNPNNYVKYNGELWRIIGVMNDIEDATGTTASHVKIIREEGLPNYYPYDNKSTPPHNYGSNDWSTSTLQKMLNSGPYWNRTSGKCPNGSNGYTSSCDFTNNGLTDTAKKMISNVVWKIGGADNPGLTTPTFYEAERGNNVPSNHEIKWTGKVGLMYPSDYGYAVEGTNTITSTITLSSYSQYTSANWLYYSNSEWTITPSTNQDFLAFYKNTSLSMQPTSYTQAVRPTLYLSSYIKVSDGDGTKEHPYELALNTDANYIVSFDSNGGEKVNTVLTVKNNTPYGELPTTNKEGFAFDGWFTEKEGGIQVSSDTIVDIADNQTLYAHWVMRGILKDGIAELAKTDKMNLTHDETEDNNIRYVGKNPNNYVKYNGELWRIIGVMNNVEDSTGTKASHVKIIRDESIGIYSWDNKSEGIGSSIEYYGSNNWTDARIMKTLNEGPYWYRESGLCYKDTNDATVKCDFSKSGLTNNAKKMISTVVWNLGGRVDTSASTPDFYNAERSDSVYSGNPTEWTGNVGLMYPSDYGYAVGGSSKSSCLSRNLSNWSSECYEQNWLYKTNESNNTIYQWAITPLINSTYNVFSMSYGGSYYSVSSTYPEVVPTLYLNSNVLVVGGNGTKDSPYDITINEDINQTYTVSFDATGGENVETTLNTTYGNTYGTLPTTTRSKFIFDGWYTDKENGKKVEENTIFDYTDNQTLYAHWIANGSPVDVIKELEKTEKKSLVYDGTDDNNLRYVGRDPQNYVWFNDELWRIIGVMNNVSDKDGNKDSYVKIVRNDIIGRFKWYHGPKDENNLYDNSDYSASKLMPLLNSGAYWNRTDEMYFDGYDSTNETYKYKYVDFAKTGLTETSRNMTSEVVWNLGGSANYHGSTNSFYTSERGESPVAGYASTWTGRVGLMQISDYGHSTGGSLRNECLDKDLQLFSKCRYYNWAPLENDSQWTLTSYSHTLNNKLYGGSIFYLPSRAYTYGYLNESWSSNDNGVRPSIYLNHNVKMQGGSGTKEKPFRLKLISEDIPNTYTLTFDSTGGNFVPTVLTVTNGEKYGQLPISSRDCYSFDGWYTEVEGGTKVTKDTIVNLAGNQTLYAHWITNILDPGNMVTSIEDLAQKNTMALKHDETKDNNIRYIGSSPNNYVEFNEELWQIIGVMNNIEDSNGKTASRVKLIASKAQDEVSTFNYAGSETSNNWTTSALKEWIAHQLTGKAKELTSDVVWNLGGHTTIDSNTSTFYAAERGDDVYEGIPETWLGKVGLMYPSDYGYSIGGEGREVCITNSFKTHDKQNCSGDSWLATRGITLTHESINKFNMFSVSDGLKTYSSPVYPVVYLDENVQIKEGTGTKDNPYKIRLINNLSSNTNTYTVSFNANEGSDVSTILTVTNNEEYGELPEATKDSYSLEGWYTEIEGGTKVTSNTIANLDSDQILYAHWINAVASAGNMITSIENLAQENTVVLAYDGTTDNNLRYIGKNPNNYVSFNDELWRIIGVMNNIENDENSKSNYIKIMRADSIYNLENGKLAWSNTGTNDWTTSSLKNLMNTGDYFNRTGDYLKDGLTENSKTMIENVVWHIGASKNEIRTPSAYYTYERGDYVYSGRTTTWQGKVGLIYPSDYGYAVGGDVRNDCLDLNMRLYDRNSCYRNDWVTYIKHNSILEIDYIYSQWTLTPRNSSSYVNDIYNYVSEKYIYSSNWNGEYARPTVYLKNNINITGGSGTESEPYTIELS